MVSIPILILDLPHFLFFPFSWLNHLYEDLPQKRERQTLMFSATFPPEIQLLAQDFLFNYIFLTVGRVGAASQNVEQKILLVEENNKLNRLVEILSENPKQRILIFVQTKRGADILDHKLRTQRFPVTSIHGDLKQWEREEALKAFKSGTSNVHSLKKEGKEETTVK